MSAFSDLIDYFSTGTYIVTRIIPGTGSLLYGVFTPPTTTTLTVSALITPASGKDLMSLPEGRRNEEVRKVRTYVPLSSAAAGPDELTIDGEQWIVFNAHRSQAFGGDLEDTTYLAMIAKKTIG